MIGTHHLLVRGERRAARKAPPPKTRWSQLGQVRTEIAKAGTPTSKEVTHKKTVVGKNMPAKSAAADATARGEDAAGAGAEAPASSGDQPKERSVGAVTGIAHKRAAGKHKGNARIGMNWAMVARGRQGGVVR